MKKWKILLFFISILLLIGVIIYINPILLLQTLSKTNALYILLAFGVVNITTVLRVMKWKVLLKEVTLKELFPVQMLGMALSNLTPGKVGEPLKSLILKITKNIPASSSLPTVFWERIFDLVVLVVLSAVCISIFSSLFAVGFVGIIISALIIFLLIVALTSRRVGEFFFKRLKKIPLLRKIRDGFLDTFYESKIEKKGLLECFVITFFTWILDGLTFFIILLSFNVPPSLYHALIFPCLIALSIVIGILSSLPGGMGSTEIVLILLITSLGFEKSLAASVVFLGRIITLGYGMFLGYLSFIYLNRKIDLKNVIKKIV